MRHLLDREIAVVAEDDGNPVIGAEPPECALERVAIVDGAMGVMRGNRRSRSIQAVMASMAVSPQVIAAGIDQDASEPGVEPIGVAKPVVIAPGPDVRVVGRIFSLLCVAEDEEGEPIRLVEGCATQPLEGGRAIGLDVGGREDPCLVAQTVLRRGMVPLPFPYLTHQGRGTFTARSDDTPAVTGFSRAGRSVSA